MSDPQQRYDQIVNKLREHSHKLTPQRLAVVKILAQSEGHPNVEAIFEQLQKNFPTMSLATVYRNVMLLKSLGEVLEVSLPDGGSRYDGNKPYPHPHVICVHCKSIVDPELDKINDLAEEVTRETGYRILTHRLDFFGICENCQKKAPEH